MRAADYITKKKGLDWTDNTIGGVYNLRQLYQKQLANNKNNHNEDHLTTM